MAGAWGGIIIRLRLAKTIDQNIYISPSHVAWASHSMSSGFQKETFQAQEFQQTMAECTTLLTGF